MEMYPKLTNSHFIHFMNSVSFNVQCSIIKLSTFHILKFYQTGELLGKVKFFNENLNTFYSKSHVNVKNMRDIIFFLEIGGRNEER